MPSYPLPVTVHAPGRWPEPPKQEPSRPAEPINLCQHELRQIVLDLIG